MNDDGSALAEEASMGMLRLALGIEEDQNKTYAFVALARCRGSNTEAILREAMQITSPYWRACAIAGVAKHAEDSVGEAAFAGFLAVAEWLPRPELLQALQTFTPLIERLFGRATLQALDAAVSDTAAWYP